MARLRARKPKTGDHKWLITAGIWVGVAASVIGLIWSQNNVVTVDDIMLESTVIPKSLNGTKLVHISDLNNTHLDIYNKVKKLNPDLIVLSGGYCDANGNYDNTYNTVDNLTNIAPVYYVYNAEDNEVGEVLEGTSAINITNGSIKIKNEREIDEYIKETYGDSFYSKYQAGDEQYVDYVEYVEQAIDESLDAEIRLIGIDSHTEENGARQALDELNGVLDSESVTYDIAITGNPLNVPALSNSPVDLILTGGTYGTGYNDSKYNKGMYDENGTKILVNGGVGGHAGVTRIFNFPEIECITFSDGSIADTNPLKDFLNGLMDTNESIDMDDKYQVYKQQKKSETVEE